MSWRKIRLQILINNWNYCKEIIMTTIEAMQQCSKFERCSAPICPLDPLIAKRYMLKEEKICPFILDYLEKKEVPFMGEIKNNRKIWEKKIGLSVLKGRLKSRIRVREYFGKNRVETV